MSAKEPIVPVEPVESDERSEDFKEGYETALRDNAFVRKNVYQRGCYDAIKDVAELLREYETGASVNCHKLADALIEEFGEKLGIEA